MKKLNDILKYAITHSQYYREIVKGRYNDNASIDIKDFPILSKNTLQNRLNDILTDKYHCSHIKMLKTVRTSGSTGQVTELYWNEDDYNASNISLWRLRKKWYGILPTSKKIVFNAMIYNGNRIAFPPKIKYYNNKRVLGVSKFHMDDTNLALYLKEMESFKPEWMLVQTSVLLRIIEFLKKYDLQLPQSIRYIELNGEMTPQFIRNNFNSFFNIPIADMYGAVEVNAIAYECPFHHKHILNQNVFVEETQDGEILVTSLQNKAVPLIRYSLGDRVHIESENCACGYEGKTIKIFEGRTTDRIKLENNSYIDPYVFLYCIEKTNLILNNSIIQYKIIQPDIDNIVMSIVLDKNYTHWSAAIIDELKKNIQNVINFQNININVNVNVVERVNNFGSEKFKIFETYI